MVLLPRLAARRPAELDAAGGYTATFRKQERLKGTLGPEQTLAMKVRNEPFAIYLKFRAPEAGKEVVYAEGHHDNKVIAHNGDWTQPARPPAGRRARPRRWPWPTTATRSPRPACSNLTEQAHRLPQAGPGRPRGRDDPRPVDRPDGRAWLRSVHTHPHHEPEPAVPGVEVLYDPETRIPAPDQQLRLAGRRRDGRARAGRAVRYDDLEARRPLTDADFDPANPAYAFSRY